LEIIIASTVGFCFGVDRAVNKALDLLNNDDVDKSNLYSLGPIIHNEQVIGLLASKGLKVIDSIDDSVLDGSIIVRAHGVCPETYQKIEEKGLSLIDATCPYVKKIHDLVKKKSDEGYTIIIIGNKEHPEVIGINGWSGNKAFVVESQEDINNLPDIDDKICVVAQTTITGDNWVKMNKLLKNRFKNMVKFDTICNATSTRQEEASEIANRVDLMIVIGSKNSSNTNKLYEICSKYCKNTFIIEVPGEVPPVDIKKIKKIGITAGASTPDWIIKEVVKKMDELNKKDVEFNFADAFEESLITLKSGDVVMGKIIGFNAAEVFVDLGFKSDGIIPMGEYSTDPDFDPETGLKVGEEIKVFVVRVNDVEGTVMLSKRKIDSLKNFEVIDEAYENKTTLSAKVTEITNGGVIAIAKGIKVFVPASQLSNKYIKDLNEFLHKTIRIRIIENNKERRKIIGSGRVILEEEKHKSSSAVWDNIEKGKKFSGTVKGFTDFGAFVDIGGVDGLVHLSELSWTRVKHPSDILNIGDTVEVTILDFDKDKKRISLSLKNEDENPWKNIADKYKVGDVIKGKITRLVPFGVFVELEKGVDGLVHISQISNFKIGKPGDLLAIGQDVEAKIVELNIESKKIGLSIKDILPETAAAEEEADDKSLESAEIKTEINAEEIVEVKTEKKKKEKAEAKTEKNAVKKPVKKPLKKKEKETEKKEKDISKDETEEITKDKEES
jgi:4-hydroxy-3-methylbut-2-enyl diphosphate reductase